MSTLVVIVALVVYAVMIRVTEWAIVRWFWCPKDHALEFAVFWPLTWTFVVPMILLAAGAIWLIERIGD